MERIEKIKIIKSNPIFDNLNEDEISKICDLAFESFFKKEDIIFKENEDADAFYIITSGKVEILKNGEDNQIETLAIKKEGDVFGEMAVIDDLPRSATIKARTDISLLKLHKKPFLDLLNSNSHISLEIARSICSTVRNSNITYIYDLEKQNKELEIAYQKLKKTQDELISTEKLSVIGKFASLIIHDIKNPMSNIRAYAELIRMNHKTDEKVLKSTGVIINEVDRLTKMTSELLEFARGEMNLNKTPVNLSSLIETLIDTVKEELSVQNISIIFKEKTDALVLLDSEKFKRVFFNLITNAIDAILTNGVITIKTAEEDSWIKCTIQDNGIGMDKDTVQRIFEPFYTTKKKGTGLGMTIVKSIIDSHNGMIMAESSKGAGTTFDIMLPKIYDA